MHPTSSAAPGAAMRTVRLRIDGEMAIYRAAELKQLLLDQAAGAELLELDLSAVTELDSSGVQLLALVRTTLAASGGALRVVAHSGAVGATLALLNLAHLTGGPADES